MTVFISGGAKNGKSTLAQNLAVALSGSGKRYYVATMIPVDEEDIDRIRRHREDRAGLGFETLECGKNVLECFTEETKGGTFLVDSATALLQNAMFPVENGYRLDMAAAKRCGDELIAFAGLAKNAIFVSDYLYSDAGRYSESTERYRRCLAEIDRRLAAVCDTVVEVCGGNYVVHKGALEL